MQAVGLVIYCGLVGLVFWQGETWFGPMHTFFGPVFLLVIFVASALISALLALGYPFILFWEKRQTIKALKLVIYTAVWLAFFSIFFSLILASLVI